tara:strand:+ start:5271 stop:7478 length:2208 start_codon:yes stop_codon:yes gene_type:complete
MQNKVQLYIEEQRVDLFSDETIEINSSIQDFRDIGKIFSDYTQSFNVPASDTNNKIFKHFYNFNITGGAYDNRKKKEAFIEINYLPFRQGKVRLNSIKMRNNKPHSYDITFLGKTVVSIQDTIGDDLISQLPYLDNYDHEYTDTNVKNGFQNGLDLNSQSDSIIYPLITSKKRLFYNSTDPVPTDANFDGNLFDDGTSTNNTRGLEFTDLKPAIKAIHIIEAIEDKYDGIEFTRDFFGSNTAFDNLYLWLNPQKEEFNYVEDNSTDQPYLFNKKLTGYTSTDPHSKITISDSKIRLNTLQYIWTLKLTFDVSSQNTAYRVIVRDVNTGVETITDGFGNKTELNIYNTYEVGIGKDIEIELSSESGVTFSNISLDTNAISSFATPPSEDKTYTITNNESQETKFNINITKKIPEMRVVDFLTGLFKTFNLTAYYIEDIGDSDYQKIYVDTLDNFYADAVNNKLTQTINLDKYVDISQHQINSILPFTDIEFKYTETDTVINEHHKEVAKKYYGNAEYNVRESLKDGTTLDYNIDRVSKYQINSPFSHLKYERILDTKLNGEITDIQWGYSAGGEFSADTSLDPSEGNYESMLIKPLLFYGVRETSISTPIAWYDGNNASSLTDYYRPSNTNETGTVTTPASFTLNFETELDEWTRAINPNSLYENFYKSYVEGIFNPLRRIFKVTAHLPASILVNYKLNHQIRIGDKIFRINNLSVDLVTGKAEFELYNIFEDDIV